MYIARPICLNVNVDTSYLQYPDETYVNYRKPSLIYSNLLL